MTSKIIIAVDGFSSTGKSTVAKELAKRLGYVYVDTGAMYRSVTLFALEQGYIIDGEIDVLGLTANLQNVHISFVYNASLGFSEVMLNGINVEDKIRGMKVSSYVSKVASITEVRQKLVILQQKIPKGKGIVMDGRDIGTVVFPNAELKLFMTASPNIRAQRRYDEMVLKGNTTVTFKEVYQNLVERDRLDTNRKGSPLLKAKDAVEIDNSNMSKEDQFAYILKLVSNRS